MSRTRTGRWGQRAQRGVALIGVAAFLASACAGRSAPASGGPSRHPARFVYPGDEWPRGDAADAGFDPVVLAEIAAEGEAHGSNCLVVIRHGRIVYDRYWNGTDPTSTQEVLSTTKSLASTLVGIAQGRDELDIDDPASDYIPRWAGTPSADVTIEDILSNSSGRHWTNTSDYQELLAAPDRTGYAVGLGQDAPPGTTWFYNNAAVQTLDAVLETATGDDPAAYAQHQLFDQIGMSHSELSHDGAGNTNLFFGLRSTCEDMARLGYLFLRRGRWEHRQIVPRAWVRASTGRPSQDMNAGYGYLWWLNRRGPVVSDPLDSTTAEEAAHAPHRQIAESAPEDIYWAWGLGGQLLQVHPSTDTVVVRLAGLEENGYGRANTTRIVTDALVDP